MAILDLVAIAPTILGFITPELYLLRVIRLVRIGRIGRSKRFQKSVSISIMPSIEEGRVANFGNLFSCRY